MTREGVSPSLFQINDKISELIEFAETKIKQKKYMACKSFALSGIALPCKDNMGGIKEVYIVKSADVTSKTLNTEESQIATIVLAESAKFKTYKFRKGTASMTSTASSDEAIGNFSVATELGLQFSKMETSKRLEIMALCLEDVEVIVLDFNGKYWYLGWDFPVSATAATAQTGTAATDLNGYNITLTDTSAEFPYEVPASVVAELIQAAPAV